MLEATCTECHETFVPADEGDLEHLQTEDGIECGGMGVLVAEYALGDGRIVATLL